MEEKDGLNGPGFTVEGDEAPQTFRVEPSVENPGAPFGVSTVPPTPAAPPPSQASALALVSSTDSKKKRGRPRKYSGDGSAAALSPMPISASIPFTDDYPTAWKHSASRSVGNFKKKHKLEFENPGKPAAYHSSGSFIPHMLTVNTGEMHIQVSSLTWLADYKDIMMKIISFSQQGSRAICILAANGTISNVTLRQPNSSGGTLTYEGRFEILSLSGSFMPSDNGVTKSRSGGMSVSLAGPDGRVLGGGLAGMLVAAGPVQIVVGSFLVPGQEQQKPKKPNYEQTISFTPVEANPISEHRYESSSYNGPKPNLTASASFNLANVNPGHGPKIAENTEHIVTFHGEDSRETSHDITC